MKFRDYAFAIILVIIFVLSLITDWYRPLVVLLMAIILVSALDKLGKGIVMRELMALHFSFVCLLMPLMGYIYYTEKNSLARLWQRYMFISEEAYFSFALPGTAAFILTLCWPLTNPSTSDNDNSLRSIIAKAKSVLNKTPYVGVILMSAGVLVFSIAGLLPDEVKFAFLLFYFSAFAGFLYVYFQPNFKMKNLILFGFAIFILGQALVSGMFTIVAYMGITLFSFFFFGRKASFVKKVIVFVSALLLLFVIQSVKLNYRRATWNNDYAGNKAVLFGELIVERFSTLKDANLEEVMFPIYYRANQGFNVALVMNRIPKFQEYDMGANLGKVLISSFVPRVFWPDKPEAGGRGNMRYYTGIVIEGWSTNIGPLGEAYGSFGINGGIIFMLALGLFVRWCYLLIFKISNKYPLVIFWLPVIFYQVTYSAESDTLQIVNSLTKSAFFVWLLYRIQPKLFGITKTVFGKMRRSENSQLTSITDLKH